MTTLDILTIHSFIARYARMLGHTPTAEHLARTFDKPVEAMRLVLAGYLEGKQS